MIHLRRSRKEPGLIHQLAIALGVETNPPKSGDVNKCEEWWKSPRVEASGEPIIDHNHICTLELNHNELCLCECGAVRPVEDYD